MKKLPRFIIILLIAIDALLVGKILIGGKNLQILNPAGQIAFQERNLIFLAVSLMLIGAVPVFIFAFIVATRYNAKKTKASYHPEWDHHTGLQIFYWAFLVIIISILSCIVWIGAHALDPHIPIEPNKKQLVVQVFSLRYKWLFVYPEQGIASLNYFEIPEKTPVTFEITASDSPMTSFWIPQLGGQIYAMSGMATQTHYIADGVGKYRGASSEINGEGFADMIFTAKSVTDSDFKEWVTTVKKSPQQLTYDLFKQLDRPGVDRQIVFYSSTPADLFRTIVMQYMAHPSANSSQNAMDQMNMNSSNSMQNMPTMEAPKGGS